MNEDTAEKMVRGAYGRTFKSGHGKQVLVHLCVLYHVRTSPELGDGIQNAYNEGQRSVVLHILEQLDPLPPTAPEEDKFSYLSELFGENFAEPAD